MGSSDQPIKFELKRLTAIAPVKLTAMPLDHYISQVHLRNFYSAALGGGLMHAIRKSDLKRFPCKARDVCRIEDGSTNAYLKEDRAIEEFLREIEPRYNASVAKLRDDAIDEESIFAIAGFAAYVSCCAPAAMRIHTGPLKGMLESTARILDKQGAFPKSPEALGGKSMTELLADGTVHFKVDQKYPQAIGISTLTKRVSIFGNSPWEILRNERRGSPFFTSDYPTSIEARGNSGIVNWIVLTPELAVRIIPDVALSRAAPDLHFSQFRVPQRTPGNEEIAELNRTIVRCAEDMVFYRDEEDWIEDFVAKNRNYRVEAITTQIPTERGVAHVASQRVVERRDTAT